MQLFNDTSKNPTSPPYLVKNERSLKLRILADSRSFLANQKARNAIVGAENLLKNIIHSCVT